MSTFFGFKFALLAETSWPALENTRSLGTDVDGTDKYFFASLASLGKWVSCCLHQSKGLSFLLNRSIAMYVSYSISNAFFAVGAFLSFSTSSSNSPHNFSLLLLQYYFFQAAFLSFHRIQRWWGDVISDVS